MATETKVAITRCTKCGLQVYGFAPATGECPRCGAREGIRSTRWIDKPHPDTVRRAVNGYVGDD